MNQLNVTIQVINHTNPNDIEKIRPSSRSLPNIKSKINPEMKAPGKPNNPNIILTFLFFFIS